MKRGIMSLLTAVLTLIFFFGCAGKSDPANFYQIAPSIEITSQDIFDAADPVPLIGVGPIYLPAYLNRPQIVTRSGNSRLHLAEFDKWAEPLEETVNRMILSELTRHLKDRDIAPVPWELKPDSAGQLIVTILRMDTSAEGDAVLAARWTLKNQEGTMILSKISSFRKPLEKMDNIEAIVTSQATNIESLCRELADAIDKKVR